MNNKANYNKHNILFASILILMSLVFITLLCLYYMFWHDIPNDTLSFQTDESTHDTVSAQTSSSTKETNDPTDTFGTEEYTQKPPITDTEVKTEENKPDLSITEMKTINIIDTDGNEQIYNILGNIVFENNTYVALLPENSDDKTGYLTFKIIKDSDNESLIPIEINDSTRSIRELLEKEVFGEYLKTEIVYKKVDNVYFQDALFIGDSMIETFIRYANVKTNSYYYRGVMISNISTKRFIESDDSGNNEKKELLTLEEAFQKNPHFKKIYLMFGTNEQGWQYFDIFKTSYKKLIELIRSYYPDAVIYVQSTLPVAPKAEKRTDAVYNNEAASIFRTYEMEICEELSGQKVYYLDVASIMTGEDGYLLDDVSLDGVHPSLKYTNLWYEFLKEHAIDEERSV